MDQIPLWNLCLLCAVACAASWDIHCHWQVAASKFCCPFSPYSLFPRRGTQWGTNIRASRIALHLKSVIWHCFATRFRDLQGGIKTFDDEYFGSGPICLIFFICSDNVWNQSYWSQEYLSSHFPDEGFREAVCELVEPERDYSLLLISGLRLTFLSWGIVDWAKTPLPCVSCLVPGSRKYEGLLWKGLGLSGKKYKICHLALPGLPTKKVIQAGHWPGRTSTCRKDDVWSSSSSRRLRRRLIWDTGGPVPGRIPSQVGPLTHCMCLLDAGKGKVRVRS